MEAKRVRVALRCRPCLEDDDVSIVNADTKDSSVRAVGVLNRIALQTCSLSLCERVPRQPLDGDFAVCGHLGIRLRFWPVRRADAILRALREILDRGSTGWVSSHPLPASNMHRSCCSGHG